MWVDTHGREMGREVQVHQRSSDEGRGTQSMGRKAWDAWHGTRTDLYLIEIRPHLNEGEELDQALCKEGRRSGGGVERGRERETRGEEERWRGEA